MCAHTAHSCFQHTPLSPKKRNTVKCTSRGPEKTGAKTRVETSPNDPLCWISRSPLQWPKQQHSPRFPTHRPTRSQNIQTWPLSLGPETRRDAMFKSSFNLLPPVQPSHDTHSDEHDSNHAYIRRALHRHIPSSSLVSGRSLGGIGV